MNGVISLKGNKYGLSVNISEDASFEEIKIGTAEYFKSASKMFKKEKIAIAFEGKPLTDDERNQLVDIIRDNCSLDILCVMDFNSQTEERFRRAVQKYDMPDFISETIEKIRQEEEKKPAKEEAESKAGDALFSENGDISKVARFFKGNVRSGMVINEESSLVILGDINPGGEIYSAGNIIILGSLKGKAFAGINGNQNAFVFALNMDPIQIRIADKIGRAADPGKTKSANTDEHEPKIALVKDNAIAIELVSRTVLNDIII